MTSEVPAIMAGCFAHVQFADNTDWNLYHFPRSSCLSSSFIFLLETIHDQTDYAQHPGNRRYDGHA